MVDEQLKRVFDDYQDEQQEQFENRNVDGWSFVQPRNLAYATKGNIGNIGGVANAGNL